MIKPIPTGKQHDWESVGCEHIRCTKCGAELEGMMLWPHDYGEECDCGSKNCKTPSKGYCAG